jgi:hypothetical protein
MVHGEVGLNRLKPPTDARAQALLGGLDQRYAAFARSLPAPLDERALQYGTFSGRPTEEPLGGLSRMNAVITGIPWLFWELYRQLPDDLFLEIAGAGALLGMASVVLDHMIDEQTESPGEAALLHQALYEAGTAGYRRAFRSDCAFWTEYDRFGKEHLQGMALEWSAQTKPHLLTLESFPRLAGARIAPMLTVVAALAELVEDWGLLSTLEASIKPVIFAGQMYDDIGDWREDHEAGHITYFLTRLAPPDAWQAPQWPSIEQLQHSIEAHWHDVEHLRMVIAWFDQGLAAVQDLECPAWVEYVTEYRAAADQHLTEFMARHLLRSIATLAPDPAGGQERTQRAAS